MAATAEASCAAKVYTDEQAPAAHVDHRRAALGSRSEPLSQQFTHRCSMRHQGSVFDDVKDTKTGSGCDRATREGTEELAFLSEGFDIAASGDDRGDRVAVAHRLAEGDNIRIESGALE